MQTLRSTLTTYLPPILFRSLGSIELNPLKTEALQSDGLVSYSGEKVNTTNLSLKNDYN